MTEEQEDSYVRNHNVQNTVRLRSTKRRGPVWNDPNTYYVRIGRRKKLLVLGWIISDDGKQVQALAEDRNPYPLHQVMIPKPPGAKKPRLLESNTFWPHGYIHSPAPDWFPMPNSRTAKRLLAGEIGTPQQQRAYANHIRRVEELRRQHPRAGEFGVLPDPSEN